MNNPGAAGSFLFTLYYNECCDGPANLLFEVNSGVVDGGTVPESNSFVLLGSGILGVAGVLRRKLLG